MCQAIRGYMAENGYTRLFVGAPAKCAGTTIARFMSNSYTLQRDWNASFCPDQFAISGRHIFPEGSLEFTRAACSGSTLFIFTVRGKTSWFESALRHVCVRWAHCALENITKVVRQRLHELHAGPSDLIAQEDAVLKNVLLLDYAATTSLLDCLPPKGLRKDTNQSALDAIYSRAGRSGLPPSIPKLNVKDNSDVYRDIAPGLLKVWDSVSKPFWPTPYVESMVQAGCSLMHFPKLL